MAWWHRLVAPDHEGRERAINRLEQAVDELDEITTALRRELALTRQVQARTDDTDRRDEDR